MRDLDLFRVLGAAAIIGGVLRIASAFVPWAPDVAWLELFYFAIDVALLFGLMGVYFADRARLGLAGLAAFAIAETGIASIVGPDTPAFGIDLYRAGALVILLGLSLLGVVMLVRRAGSAIAASCWIASTVVSVGGAVAQSELGFIAGGVLFGLGFVAAGWTLVSPSDRIKETA